MDEERLPLNDVDDAVAWVGDSGLFIACGRQQNNKYTALERFARRHDITFVIPQRVYEELGGAPTGAHLDRHQSIAQPTPAGSQLQTTQTTRTAQCHA